MKNKTRKKQLSKWEENQDKAEAMCEKFINILSKIDGFHKWECILLKAILKRLQKDNDFDGIVATLEIDFGFRVLKVDSMVQEMKIDAFIEELKQNPYQLKLIA
jgi:hypothetical protein